ncbi:cytidine deaminase-like protein [Obba rivulosa]|uniref:Cytidine deaminase-like protein n=1 Tax=Obba rivulosa TaxID=1052685 RepID=A0A8E2DPK3_9APHY|nr:cytidine deaminase-like protein [Obba rivulosa]
MSETSGEHIHITLIRLALDEARKCEPTPTAFCVGCVLVLPSDSGPGVILARGFSRELPGNTHAEANALTKAHQLSQSQLHDLLPSVPAQMHIDVDDILTRADIYTTMEPCSVRTSGLAPCADAIIAAKLRRCYIGVGEPDDFVNCEGARKLVDAGIEVHWIKGLEEDCLRQARRGHDRSQVEFHMIDLLYNLLTILFNRQTNRS